MSTSYVQCSNDARFESDDIDLSTPALDGDYEDNVESGSNEIDL